MPLPCKRFRDRADAGKQLAFQLTKKNLQSPLIFGLARGGVPIADEVARVLKVPVDVLVVRKIGAPGNPEYGIGAITEDGYYWINQQAAAGAGVDTIDLGAEKKEVSRRIKRYRGNRPRVDVRGQSVVLVDDGLATGVTAKVAAEYLRKQGAAHVLIAVPVGSTQSIKSLRALHYSVFALEESDVFFSVSQFYADFNQVSDDEVVSLLSRHFSSVTAEAASVGAQIEIRIPISVPDQLEASLEALVGFPSKNPEESQGMVIFAHGSGSSRKSPRNLEVAHFLNRAGFSTLLFDLLTADEAQRRENVFNIGLLADRLKTVTQYVRSQPWGLSIPIGYFGASTGAAAALWASADLTGQIAAVVSRGGRPDLATTRLPDVLAPTLLIVGGFDDVVIEMNRSVLPALKRAKKAEIVIIPEASHLFEEPGKMEQVSQYATRWFQDYLKSNVTRIKQSA